MGYNTYIATTEKESDGKREISKIILDNSGDKEFIRVSYLHTP